MSICFKGCLSVQQIQLFCAVCSFAVIYAASGGKFMNKKLLSVVAAAAFMLGGVGAEGDVIRDILPMTIDAGAADSFTASQVAINKDYACSPQAIRIYWSKVAGAEGYRIYRYTSSGWKGLKNVSANTTSFYEGNLESGTAYKYCVRAYKKSGSGYAWTKLSKDKYVTTKPKAVTLTSKAGAKNGVTLKWGVQKSNGYQVYYKVHGTDGWIYAGSTSHMNRNSFTVGVLKEDTNYDFAVRPYRTDNDGRVNCGAFTLTTCSTNSGSIGNVNFKTDYTSTTGSVTFSWNKVQGAMGYRVYRYDYQNNKWVILKNVGCDTTSYTDSNLSGLSADEQRYTVRAFANYGGSIIFSPAINNKYVRFLPKKPEFSQNEVTSISVLLSGDNRTDYSTGYDVYYKESGASGWTFNSTTTGGHTRALIINGIPKGKSYQVAVRNYVKDRNGKRLNGAYQYFNVTIPSSYTPSARANSVLEQVNKERAAQGLSKLTLDPKLCELATIRAYELAEEFDHVRPDGSSGLSILDEHSYSYTAAAENIAYGYSTVADVMSAWMNSTGHRGAILNKDYKKLGVGYCPTDNKWTQLFTN